MMLSKYNDFYIRHFVILLPLANYLRKQMDKTNRKNITTKTQKHNTVIARERSERSNLFNYTTFYE